MNMAPSPLVITVGPPSLNPPSNAWLDPKDLDVAHPTFPTRLSQPPSSTQQSSPYQSLTNNFPDYLSQGITQVCVYIY